MNHVELAFRNLRRRPARSLLTMLGVAVAVGSFITLYGLSRSAYENVQQSIEELPTDLTVRRGTAELFGGTIPQSLAAQVAEFPGVSAVTCELLSLVESDNGDHVLVAGWAEDSFFWQDVPLEEGWLPQQGERKVALVGIDLAGVLQNRAGDTWHSWVILSGVARREAKSSSCTSAGIVWTCLAAGRNFWRNCASPRRIALAGGVLQDLDDSLHALSTRAGSCASEVS